MININNRSIYSKVIHLCIATLFLNSSYSYSFDCSEALKYGIPDTSHKVELLCKSAFVNGFDRSIGEPRWSLMIVTKNSINRTCDEQPDFIPDPEIPEYAQADNNAYYNNQWDKGHLSDRATIDSTCLAEREATYYTNAVPQHERMNRVGWRTLESRIRTVINKLGNEDEVYILTGTIIITNRKILDTNIVIPDKIYKAVYIPSLEQSAVFVYDNAVLKTEDLKNGIMTLDDFYNEYGVNTFYVPNGSAIGLKLLGVIK